MSDSETPAQPIVLRADDRARLPLHRLGVRPGDHYAARRRDDGAIVLQPLNLGDNDR